MIKHLQVATICVSDQNRARDFFVNTLGFGLRREMEVPGGMHWIEVAPEGGQTSFSLEPCSEPERLGIHTGYVFATDDIDAAYKELTGRGVHFPQPPNFQGWGIYSEFEDLDGNRFGLAQASNAQSDSGA